MDLSKYKSLFITESQEHLDGMTQKLLALEKDPSNSESLEELFRHAHSIKGMASSMGYTLIEKLSHRLEDLLDDIRKGKISADSEAIDVLLNARDALEKMVLEVGEKDEPEFRGANKLIFTVENFRKTKAGSKIETTTQVDEFGDLDGEVVSPSVIMARNERNVEVSGDSDYHSQQTLSSHEKTWFITTKISATEASSARAFLALKRITGLGKVESTPSIDEIRAGKFDGKLTIKLTTDVGMAKITSLLNSLADVKEYQIEPYESETIAKPQPIDSSPMFGDTSHSNSSYELPQTLKIGTKALDKFVNMVGELLTVKSALRDIARSFSSPELDNRLDRLEALIHELHSNVMGIRMMPLESISLRFPRIVRDLARQAGKEVDFQMRGQNVELDRAILERLIDPLIHILRNSVDHGIEPPSERVSLRKPRIGKIVLSAYREKDNVVIEVSDDGKGIDVEVVKESAIAKGIITPENADILTHDEALMLICVPGFSTSEQVTFISGRGVGMDIVRSTIESIGGTLRINTILGKGTVITLVLPRTVAIMNVLLVRLEPHIFALPIGKLIRTLEIRKEEIQISQRGKMIIFEGEPIPLQSLRKLLKLEESENEKTVCPAIVVEHSRKKWAVLVDDFMGQEEAFIKPLNRPLSYVEGLSGVMTMGDGKPVFVLDMGNLLQ